MRKQLPVETDLIDDQVDLHDEELRKQIADGYEAYLREETNDLDKLIAELRNNLNTQKAEGQ